MTRSVHVIAVPYDSARRAERMGAGPLRLLDAGLATRLEADGHHVSVTTIEASPDRWRAEIATAFDLAAQVSLAVRSAIAARAFPLVLSGNCGPAALGCIAALKRPLRIFWFDAHGDFNTPETSIGGFLDGMAIATVTGRCWTQLAAAVPGFAPVREDTVMLIGARDLDPLERQALESSSITLVGPEALRSELPARLAEARPEGTTYLHLDLDVLDPSDAQVNSYAAPGGLRLADVDWALSAIGRKARFSAASLTALDPECDDRGRGVHAAVALAATIVRHSTEG